MGEAGGGLLWNLPSKTLHGGAGETSAPLIGIVCLAYSSFSVLRETPIAFFYDYFKKPNGYLSSLSKNLAHGTRIDNPHIAFQVVSTKSRFRSLDTPCKQGYASEALPVWNHTVSS
jgi:hypothetical protein